MNYKRKIFVIIISLFILCLIVVSAKGGFEECSEENSRVARLLPSNAYNIIELGNWWYMFCLHDKQYLFHKNYDYHRASESLVYIGKCEQN